MAQLDPQTCEAKIADSWHLIRLDEALSTHITALKRCPVCYGPIMIKLFGKTGRPKLFHGKGHTGCPRAPTVYSGVPAPHPDPVV